MALFTKVQVRAAIQQAIDDPNGKRWTSANLDILTTMMADLMWSAILDTFEELTNQQDTVTPDASGRVDVTTLTKRFYRVQAVTKTSDSTDVQPKRFRQKFPQQTYYMLGNNIVTEPVITGSNALRVNYAFLPTRFNDLANDATVLPSEYPDGHEMALVYLTAAAAMAKGDAESIAQIGRLADAAVEALLTHIARRYPIATAQGIAVVKSAIMRNPLVANGAQ